MDNKSSKNIIKNIELRKVKKNALNYIESQYKNMQTAVTNAAERIKTERNEKLIKKYNPVFPTEFFSADFSLPNVIVIVDDAIRRGIDVCEGAIGWIENKHEIEVLYLYDEAVKLSKIEFVPVATCDSVYYVDSFQRTRFINVNNVFDKAHEEKIAELKHIANALGAKSCSIDFIEVEKEEQRRSGEIKEKLAGKCDLHVEYSAQSDNKQRRSGHVHAEFNGNSTPKTPQLKWFRFDENIKQLINIRCSSDNSIVSETIEISGASSATMSIKTAHSLHCIMGTIGTENSSKLEKRATKEHLTKLVFHIQF